MPRINGISALGILLAAIAMFFVGFVFYGLLFTDVWMAARGYTPDMAEGQSPAWMGAGFLIELILACGLAWIIGRSGHVNLGGAVMTGLAVGLLLIVPTVAYEFVYGFYHSVPGFLVDAGHKLIAAMVGSAVLSFFHRP